MSDASVHVVVRVRPENELEAARSGRKAVLLDAAKPKEIRVAEGSAGTAQGTDAFSRFTFDRVFTPKSQQDEVFQTIGVPLVENVFQGYNGTIFAYGQTSSGKTHTMQGPDINDPVLAGIIPRTVAAIFDNISAASEQMEFTVRASFVEIYLERIRDLLDPSRQNLQVREDPKKGIYVEGMSEQYVNSFEEMMDLMALGSSNRATSATGMNEGSSRSHSVFMVHLAQKDTQTGTAKTSKINLVDLAGSEMVRKTGATGERLDEAKMINLSLSALGNVINALTDGKSAHVPYRDSKLTRMLQESLGGNARTWLVINVSPSSYNAPETLNTLRFGHRAKSIKNKAVVNQERTVEELETLLARAEQAIDVQTKYIEKLKRSRGMKDESGEASRIAQLEMKVKELESAHENDQKELERSNTEIRILSEELREATNSPTDLQALHEKIASLTSEKEVTETKLAQLMSRCEQLEYEHKESSLALSTLQEENRRLSEELDVSGSRTTRKVDPDASVEERLAAEKALNRRLQEDLQAQKEKLAQLEKNDGATCIDEGTGMDPAREQRLQKLIAVHKQLLRKFAQAEVELKEKKQLLELKEGRIRTLEGKLKDKEFNFRAQAERHALELEEMHLERQREVQRLQMEANRAKKELNDHKASFSSKALSFMNKRGRSPIANPSSSIVKPLRGGTAASSSASSGEDASGNRSPNFLNWLSPSKNPQ